MNTKGRKNNNQYFHMSIKKCSLFRSIHDRQLIFALAQQRAFTILIKPGIPKLNETLLLAESMKLPMSH